MQYLKKTDNPEEMIQIGRRIAEDKKDLYSPSMMEKMMRGVEGHIPDASAEEKEQMVYRAIYDYWVYGANVDEEFYLKFYEKTDDEKKNYVVDALRFVYLKRLNSGGGKEIRELLQDKYKLYQRLKPYYQRDLIQVSSLSDLSSFSSFVQKHPVFVVKPSDYYYGIGVHKVDLKQYANDPQLALEEILKEGDDIRKSHPSRANTMVLEELIIQDSALSLIHPESVNTIRATAVRGKDGKIHVYHPWIKVGANGTFVATAVLGGFDAEIDSESGVVISDGYQESGRIISIHPNTGIQIKGFKIPRWEELIKIVNELMSLLPEYGYIGWDMALTSKGWCVVEGNYSGEFIFQMINGRGYRKEFEDLIGWKFDKEFWWQG